MATEISCIAIFKCNIYFLSEYNTFFQASPLPESTIAPLTSDLSGQGLTQQVAWEVDRQNDAHRQHAYHNQQTDDVPLERQVMNGIFTALLPDLLVPAGNETHVSRPSYFMIETMLDYRVWTTDYKERNIKYKGWSFRYGIVST